MTSAPVLISEENSISRAWARCFLRALTTPRSSQSPLLLTIAFANGEPEENGTLKVEVDHALAKCGCWSVGDTASTIFPFDYWSLEPRPSAEQLFQWYLTQYLPRAKVRAKRANAYGTYFERMIHFRGIGSDGEEVAKNQLNQIIQQWHRDGQNGKRPRQSALQAAIFDPPKDHVGQPRRGFPCLQQVWFSYDDNGGLGVNALYPTQDIFSRAYGNYLGLSHLGMFMAHELGLKLVRFTCLVTHPDIAAPKGGKETLAGLAEAAAAVLGAE